MFLSHQNPLIVSAVSGRSRRMPMRWMHTEGFSVRRAGACLKPLDEPSPNHGPAVVAKFALPATDGYDRPTPLRNDRPRNDDVNRFPCPWIRWETVPPREVPSVPHLRTGVCRAR